VGRHFLPAVGVCESVMARRQTFYSRKWAGNEGEGREAAGRKGGWHAFTVMRAPSLCHYKAALDAGDEVETTKHHCWH
jgi:hypothetical protein